LGAAAVLAAALPASLLLGGGDDDGKRAASAPSRAVEPAARFVRSVTGPRSAPFALSYQRGWERITARDLGDATVGIKRRDGRGAVTLSVGGRLDADGLARVGAELRGELAKRFDDLSHVNSRVVDVAAGQALYTSWVREEKGVVQSSLVVPDGGRTYLLDAMVIGTAGDVATEVGTIFQAFDTATDR
jgi:hypothetical protein